MKSSLVCILIPDTTEKSLAGVVKDVLLRLNLPMHGSRGQTYDGAANMSGKHAGAQVLTKQEQPLALYIHCGACHVKTTPACPSSGLEGQAQDHHSLEHFVKYLLVQMYTNQSVIKDKKDHWR